MHSPKPRRIQPQEHLRVTSGPHKGLRVVSLTEQEDNVWACCPAELPTRTLFLDAHLLTHESNG
jgi:hypothetical protein